MLSIWFAFRYAQNFDWVYTIVWTFESKIEGVGLVFVNKYYLRNLEVLLQKSKTN